MDKFIKLIPYLDSLKEEKIALSFEELETILGTKLCDSAKRYQAYWIPSVRHTLASLIDSCGFKAEPDFDRGGLVIRKKESSQKKSK